MSSGTRNKSAGNSWELVCVKYMHGVGYPNAATSRLVSRLRDNQKIDIANMDEDADGRLPYNVQCKNLSKQCNYPLVLSEMPQGNQINVIFHKQTKKVGTRFMPMGEFACLKLSDFLSIVKEKNALKQAFDILNNYFDYVPDEEKVVVNEKLRALGL